MNRKYIILIVAVTLLIIVVVAFWLTRPKKPSGPTELNWVTYNEEEKNFKDIIEAYEKENNVKINFIKKDPKNYEIESLNSISTGKIDIWGIPDNWLPKHLNKLSTFPSQNSTEEKQNVADYKNLYPVIIVSENIIKDKIYGFPLSIDPLVLYLGTEAKSEATRGREFTPGQEDLLNKTQINWDDLWNQVQLLTKKEGGSITLSGAALGTSQIPAASDILTLMMLQNGAQMTSEDHSEATFHTAINKFGGENFPGARALEFYTSFAQPGSNQVFSDALGDPLRAFAQGKIVYYLDFQSRESEIKLINPDASYNIRELPQVKETKKPVYLIRYETFAVPNSSKNQAAAWDFLNYLVSGDNIGTYYSASKNSPALSSKLEINKTIIENAATWYNPDAVETDKIFCSAIDQVLAGKSAQTVLDGTAQQVTDLLKKLKE